MHTVWFVTHVSSAGFTLLMLARGRGRHCCRHLHRAQGVQLPPCVFLMLRQLLYVHNLQCISCVSVSGTVKAYTGMPQRMLHLTPA